MTGAATSWERKRGWRKALSALLTSARLATTSLSHDWRRTWFTVSILTLAGVIAYVQLAATTAQLLSYGSVERQATAEIVVLDWEAASRNGRGLRPLRPEVVAALSASASVGAYEPLRGRSARIPLPKNVGYRQYLSVAIVDPIPPALSAPRSLSDEAKRLLSLPNSLILTDVDARTTGLALGDEVELNGRSLRVVASYGEALARTVR